MESNVPCRGKFYIKPCLAILFITCVCSEGFVTQLGCMHKLPQAFQQAKSVKRHLDMVITSWREARAMELAGTVDKWQEQLERNKIPQLKNRDIWAHEIDNPELGGLVVAPALSNGEEYMKECVMLITDHHNEHGTVGIMLNKPSSYCVGDVLNGGEMQAFRNNQIYLGGEDGNEGDIGFMHRYKNISGAREILPGLYIGGNPVEATRMINLGIAREDGFKFYLQHKLWAPGQLKKEVAEHKWHLVACSQELLVRTDVNEDGPLWRAYAQKCLKDPLSNETYAPLWREIMRLLGGKHDLIARAVYNEV